uniref:Uncharacterized protein n=1 Tax=Oryza glaberrima TaxID=4538 RepID=I1Q810_ORYGL
DSAAAGVVAWKTERNRQIVGPHRYSARSWRVWPPAGINWLMPKLSRWVMYVFSVSMTLMMSLLLKYMFLVSVMDEHHHFSWHCVPPLLS